MFVFLSKLLPPLVYPLGLAVVLVVSALLLRKRTRLRTTFEILTLLILLAGSNHWVAFALARSLEWQYIPSTIPSADVIVVLGGGTEPGQSPRPMAEVNGAGNRVVYTAALFKQGKAPLILASGGNITFLEKRSTTPASDMADLLVLMGIPRQAIWLENQSQNTHENALYCARILKTKGITRVILVTSAMHMPRSVALFRKEGIEPIPAPSDFNVTVDGWNELGSSPGAVLVNLLPNASSLSLTSSALKEYIGLLTYRFRGWL